MQVSYEITRDSQLLGEYYQLRERCYQQELQLSTFDGSEEAADRNGYIFIASNSDGCLGGARIAQNAEALLTNLSLTNVMSTLGLDPGSSCIWERLAISRDLRERKRQPEFCDHLINVSRSLGYDYAFMVSSVRNARFYRLCHSTLNVEFQICHQVPCSPTGGFENLEHVLSVAHLRTTEFQEQTTSFPSFVPDPDYSRTQYSRAEYSRTQYSRKQRPTYGVAA